MSEVMITADKLTKRYGDTLALDRVSFEVRGGEVLGFLGPNGAGKTTTMKILTCFISPTEGTARVRGADIFEDSLSVRNSIGYLPESTPLYSEMLVLEYLRWVAEMRGLPAQSSSDRIRRVVEETSLGGVIAKEIRALSKGYRQRVGLAQALLHEPPILILDEPMSGLDPNQAVEIRDLIRDIGKERTVILSTHNLAEVEVACDRVLIIANGKLVADDTPAGLRKSAGKARFLVSFLRPEGSAGTDVKGVLEKLDGVDSVRPEGPANGEISFEVRPAGDDDLRPQLFKAAVDQGLTLIELRREGQDLEGVFRDLTVEENA